MLTIGDVLRMPDILSMPEDYSPIGEVPQMLYSSNDYSKFASTIKARPTQESFQRKILTQTVRLCAFTLCNEYLYILVVA